MKVEGLGDERRKSLWQISLLVGDVQDFRFAQFKELVNGYEKQDPVLHGILTEAFGRAEEHYTDFLDAKASGRSSKFWQLDKLPNLEHDTVLGKAMSEIRGIISNEKEFRRDFLVKEIGDVSRAWDERLRKGQWEELKLERERARAARQVGRRSGGHDFGL